MILRTPTFYNRFKCIGGDCKKSCCIGWELEVDKDTFDYYSTIEGAFGDRLKKELSCADSNSEDGEVYSFSLPVNGRCPFLNSNNLCDIVLNLGEGALCDICTDYPRYQYSYGDTVERSLSLSCEEAARLLFEEKGFLEFCDLEMSVEELFGEDAYWEEDDLDSRDISHYLSFREEIFNKIKNENISFEELTDLLVEKEDYPELRSKDERLRMLSLLEPIDSDWTTVLKKLSKNTHKVSFPKDDRIYRNLLIYFIFRYLPGGLFDGDFKTKIRFSLFCVYCINDINEVLSDLAESTSVFSREVEHSEDNIECIFEELLFN